MFFGSTASVSLRNLGFVAAGNCAETLSCGANCEAVKALRTDHAAVHEDEWLQQLCN